MELRREAPRHDRADASAAGCVPRATRRRGARPRRARGERLPYGGSAAGGHDSTYDACGVGNIDGS